VRPGALRVLRVGGPSTSVDIWITLIRGQRLGAAALAGARAAAPSELVPALEADLLGLLLDVLVVERGPVRGRSQPGTDLDGDLLQGRALNRRRELERGRDLPSLHIGHHVLDRRRDR